MIDKKMITRVTVYLLVACAVAVGATMWKNSQKVRDPQECVECEHAH